MEADPRSPAREGLGPFGFVFVAGDLGPGFIPHTTLLVVRELVGEIVVGEIAPPS